MNFDTFSIAAIVTELRSTALGGRVQRIVQINSLIFGFEIFVHPIRYYLIVSVEPQAPRMHLSEPKVRRGSGHDSPLMLVLRKYLRGARLTAIELPAYERLVYFQFLGPLGATMLAAEMLGTRSNLVFIDANQTILGTARLVKPEQAGQRVIIPGHSYEPPPPQHKLTPPELTQPALIQEISEASPKLRLFRFLPGIVGGVSPLLAREITYRATGQTNIKVGDLADPAPLVAALRELFEHLWNETWQPTLAVDEEDHPVAFAPYPLHHLPRTRPVDTFSAAVETYYAEVTSGYSAAKIPLFEAIKKTRQRIKRRHERLAEDAEAQADPMLLKKKGEAILAYAHQIEAGQSEVSLDWLPGEPPLHIALDPALSPSDNAQQYFSRYRKALRAGDEIPAQLDKIELEERYLDQLEQDLTVAENRPEIDTVAEALAEAGYHRPKRRRKRQKSTTSHYLRLTAPEGATVWVGKNALQNAHLTFNRAASDDLWLHARDVPGAHVIMPTAEGLPSEADVFWAAGVAAYYSRARRDTSVEVDVTVKKYVRAIKGAAPGLVTYRNESTFRVTPIDPDLDEE